MKKYLQSGWMRILSCILCALSIVSLGIGVLGFIFVTEFRDKDGIYESGYKEVAENYALYAIHMVENGKEEELIKEFEEKEINCSIQLMLNVPDEDGNIVTSVEKQLLIGEVKASEMMELELVAGADIRWCENSLLGVLLGYPYYYDGTEWIEYPIEKVVYDPSHGMFYYKTSHGLYRVEEIEVKSVDQGYYDYSLNEKEGHFYYYNGYYNITLDSSQYPIWEWVRIHGYRMTLGTGGEWGSKVEILPAGSISLDEINKDGFYVYSDMISAPNTDVLDMYQVQVSWSRGEGAHSLFTEWTDLSNMLIAFDTYAVPMIIISFILVLASFGLVVYSASSDREKLGLMQRTPVACYSLVTYLVVVGIAMGALELGNWLITDDVGRLSDMVTLALLVVVVMIWIVLAWFQNVVTRIKCRSFWRTSEVYYAYLLLKKGWKYVSKPMKWLWGILTAPFRAMGTVCREVIHFAKTNISVFLGGMILFVGVSFVELMLYLYFRWNGETLLAAFLVVKVVELVGLIIVLYHMQQLHQGSKRIASGDLSTPVDTGRMYWKFKEHGENINKVSEGISLAVNERMKSERFKTELITNVSHDIKTPLTSIINYVDLIKKEEIQDEKVQGYVEVLDRQSARLKKLIEDLMEASKASTGNLTVNLEECDVEVLLTQIVGEFEEKLQKNQLEVIVDKPDYPIKMMADGRHMWRVLDNLLNNACKYSLAGTRVYVSLQKEKNDVVIVFKNISKTALNIPSEELMERFVRGDSSRNTEGSGLGLSIAQSLTELMHGTMKLEIDGDLFKVILRFPMIT